LWRQFVIHGTGHCLIVFIIVVATMINAEQILTHTYRHFLEYERKSLAY